VSKTEGVFPVFLFNNRNFGGKGEILKSQIEFYSVMIKNFKSNLNKMEFFFTNFPKEAKI
jgi:hypothetical protein